MLRPLLLTLLFFSAAASAGAGWEDHERLRAAAAAALDSDSVRISVDPNTRVPRCGSPPQARVRARNQRSASMEIVCEAPRWRIYVPARDEGDRRVALLAQPLPAGHVLTASDLRMASRPAAATGYGAFDDPQQLLGRQLRRALPEGAVLGPGDLQSEQLVSTGDTVTLISRHQGVEVRMQGRATTHGARNDQITVVNTGSGRKVRGIVVAAGQVEVSP